MTSRGTWPLTASTPRRPREPGRASAGEPGATATTRGAGHPPRIRRRSPVASIVDGRRPRAARLAPRLLRRGRDGDQGAGVDGAGLRAAGVLLPRDRPQQARRRSLHGPRRGLRRRRRPRCPTARPIMLSAHGSAPEVVAAARARRAATSSTRSARSSPRCTTRCRCAPARATASSTSATRATRRPSARWRSRPTPCTASSRPTTSLALPDLRRARRAPRADDALAPRLGRRARDGTRERARACGCPAAATCASPRRTASPR